MCDYFSECIAGKVFKNRVDRDKYDLAFKAMRDFGERAKFMSNRYSVEGFVDAFIFQHRTTQQSIVRLFVVMLRKWADGKEKMLVDDRNQAAWEFAKHLRGAEQLCSFPLF